MLPNSTASAAKRLTAAGVEVLDKADCEPKRFVREFRVPPGERKVGEELKVDALRGRQASVDVTGISKGAAPPA